MLTRPRSSVRVSQTSRRQSCSNTPRTVNCSTRVRSCHHHLGHPHRAPATLSSPLYTHTQMAERGHLPIEFTNSHHVDPPRIATTKICVPSCRIVGQDVCLSQNLILPRRHAMEYRVRSRWSVCSRLRSPFMHTQPLEGGAPSPSVSHGILAWIHSTHRCRTPTSR